MDLSGVALPCTMQPAAEARTPLADGDVPMCLDFLKGRCSRKRCRFLHPDLSQFQQLSGAVQAQAGRQMCEVWAMTGQCKFGAKCSRLHPVVLNQHDQPVMTLYLPMGVMPQPMHLSSTEAPAATMPVLPRQESASAASSTLPSTPLSPPEVFAPLMGAFATSPSPPITRPSSRPFFSSVNQGTPGTPFMPAPVNPVVLPSPVDQPPDLLRPLHVVPQLGLQPSILDLEVDLQGMANAALKALETGKRDVHNVDPIARGPTQATSGNERSRSLACLFSSDYETERPLVGPAPLVGRGLDARNPPRRRLPSAQHERDRAFLDMLRDLHNAGC